MKTAYIECSACWRIEDKIGQTPIMERVLKATSTAVQTKEIIDNGLLPKRVERLADVSEMVKQRADDDKS
jgi:hypothetical protein